LHCQNGKGKPLEIAKGFGMDSFRQFVKDFGNLLRNTQIKLIPAGQMFYELSLMKNHGNGATSQ
jgi:hypothetical protein